MDDLTALPPFAGYCTWVGRYRRLGRVLFPGIDLWRGRAPSAVLV